MNFIRSSNLSFPLSINKFFNRLFALFPSIFLYSFKNYISGHIQQGDTPTSFDRSLGVKLGAKAIDWLYDNLDKFKNGAGKICTQLPESVMVIGLFGDQYCYTPMEELVPYIDFEYVSLSVNYLSSLGLS